MTNRDEWFVNWVNIIPFSDLCITMEPPTLLLDHATRVDRSNRLPRWCSLPMPGTHLLVTGTTSINPVMIPIDRRRSYLIGGSPEADVVIRELNGVRLILMHHRNGNVYLSTCNHAGSPPISDVTGYVEGGILVTFSAVPFELQTDTPIKVNEIQLMVSRRTGKKVLRECLREFTAADEQTRNNTLTNIGSDVSLHKHHRNGSATHECTPQSARYMKKRRKRDVVDNVARSVQFIDI
jgi:hypothetical protein